MTDINNVNLCNTSSSVQEGELFFSFLLSYDSASAAVVCFRGRKRPKILARSNIILNERI